jgi:hexulose-6-phosphate isomerase
MVEQAESRRAFLSRVSGAVAAGSLAAGSLSGGVWSQLARAAEDSPQPKLKKAVKFGMIAGNEPIDEKFALLKLLGFQGVEMDSPSNVNIQAAVSARDKTGIDIHGVVDSIHWNVRLSDPDPAVRAKGLEGLRTALTDAKAYGATTVLLVPGKVSNAETENYDQVYARSQEEIRKALPLADELGVKIAIEVVWNNFITKPEQLVQYVDDFQTPTVGAYFDVSNMIKYGVPPADWIRALGKRMLKFDFKGYSNTNKWVDIGQGDENWPDVLKALDEIGYHGWATAEVGAGGADHLRKVSQQMDKVLGLE